MSAVTGGGGKCVFSPTLSTEREVVRSQLRDWERSNLTFAQSKNPNSALFAPSIRKFAGSFRDLSKGDDRFESWKFRGQAEQCGHILWLDKNDAEVGVIDAVWFRL